MLYILILVLPIIKKPARGKKTMRSDDQRRNLKNSLRFLITLLYSITTNVVIDSKQIEKPRNLLIPTERRFNPQIPSIKEK